MKQILHLLGIAIVLTFVVTLAGCIGGEPAGNLEYKTFKSCEEMKTFLKNNAGAGFEYYGYGGFGTAGNVAMPTSAPGGTKQTTESGDGATDYSTTNIQVEGVDEADFVKNDGKYIYTITGNKVVILDAYPAQNARILSEINDTGNPSQIFINGDKLVVFSETQPQVSMQQAAIFVYDVADRANPILLKNYLVDGNYVESRMVGDYVYAVITKPIQTPFQTPYYYDGYGYSEEPGLPASEDWNVSLPKIYDNGAEMPCACGDIHYFDYPDYSYVFTNIVSIDLKTDELSNDVFMTGYTEEMYVSEKNIYLTHQKRISNKEMMDIYYEEVWQKLLPANIALQIKQIMDSDLPYYEKTQNTSAIIEDYFNYLDNATKADFYEKMNDYSEAAYEKIWAEQEKTVINKLRIENGKAEYKAEGEVPGDVLNQFSMDEYDGYFRIATTTGHVSRMMTDGGPTSSNNVYILNNDMKTVGKLEDLAKGEKIYSARFLGKKGYLVTFVKVDPLFVIDLSNPTDPKVLGELKIPGYSDYLHPYDENHLIGIGKWAVPSEEENANFAWYQGVKISLFDVTDVANPAELSHVEIGDRGTDSYALHEHKAFLFSKAKNLLVVPIELAEIPEGQPKFEEGGWPAYGETVFQGAYVYDLTVENGFKLKGRITHANESEFGGQDYYYYGSPTAVQRSLYMDDTLYTISEAAVKANDLTTMDEIIRVDLPYEYENYYGYPEMRGV